MSPVNLLHTILLLVLRVFKSAKGLAINRNITRTGAISKMDKEQFETYLDHLDHPRQLKLSADVPSLYLLYREHMTRYV